MALHYREEQGDPLNPVADPDHQHFEEGLELDHSVAQVRRWEGLDASPSANCTVGVGAHLQYVEGLDHSVPQEYSWGTVVLHWEEQGIPLNPVADPGHAGSC